MTVVVGGHKETGRKNVQFSSSIDWSKELEKSKLGHKQRKIKKICKKFRKVRGWLPEHSGAAPV